MAKLPMEFDCDFAQKSITMDSGKTGTLHYWETDHLCFVNFNINGVSGSSYQSVNTTNKLPACVEECIFDVAHSTDGTHAIAKLKSNGELQFLVSGTYTQFIGAFCYAKA